MEYERNPVLEVEPTGQRGLKVTGPVVAKMALTLKNCFVIISKV